MEGAAVGVTVSILVMVVCAKKKLYVRPQLIRWQLYILVVNSGSVMFSIEAISDSGKSGPASEVVGINTDAVSEISVFNAGKGGAVVSWAFDGLKMAEMRAPIKSTSVVVVAVATAAFVLVVAAAWVLVASSRSWVLVFGASASSSSSSSNVVPGQWTLIHSVKHVSLPQSSIQFRALFTFSPKMD